MRRAADQSLHTIRLAGVNFSSGQNADILSHRYRKSGIYYFKLKLMWLFSVTEWGFYAHGRGTEPKYWRSPSFLNLPFNQRFQLDHMPRKRLLPLTETLRFACHIEQAFPENSTSPQS